MKESTFADRLKALLERDNMSYRDLEEKTGITTVTISRVLNGDRPLSAPNIVKIANAFGIDVRYFFCEEEEKDMYLRKNGQVITGEWKPEIIETGDKPKTGEVLTTMKVAFFDILIDMFQHECTMEDIYGMMIKMNSMIDILARLDEGK